MTDGLFTSNVPDQTRFRCEACGRYASRVRGSAVEFRDVGGLDVCLGCFHDAMKGHKDDD